MNTLTVTFRVGPRSRNITFNGDRSIGSLVGDPVFNGVIQAPENPNIRVNGVLVEESHIARDGDVITLESTTTEKN